MNVINTSGDELPECPLCMEPLEVDDLSFYPCTCGYQICRFCWHRIRTDENELCPACRKAYPENPADFKPLTQEQISALKADKRQRDQQRKQKITENRKHLANVRVVQKNLVFVVGLPPRLADAEILKKHEYFGKYGKIHKVVINPSTTYAGVQGPSASAYVTYVHNNDALRAIQSVNNIAIDGRSIKTSLGTTKYCSHFMKNQVCPKPDCMYLHELGDTEASFTKEEMHQGKHQEYEKRLHDSLIAQMQSQQTSTVTIPTTASGTNTSSTSPVNNISGCSNSSGVKPISGISKETASSSNSASSSSSTNDQVQNEAWPSLSISSSPVNTKECKSNGKSNGSGVKENGRNEANRKYEKMKSEKTKGNSKISKNHQLAKESNKREHHQQIADEDDLGETDSSDSLSQEDRKADTPSMSSSTDSGTVSESDSGKSLSPTSFPDPIHRGHNNKIVNVTASQHEKQQQQQHMENIDQQNKSIISSPSSNNTVIDANDIASLYTNNTEKITSLKESGNLADTSRFSKLNLFDDNSSFFSRSVFNSVSSKLDSGSEHSQIMNNAQLPDLLSGTLNNNNSMSSDSMDPKLKNLGSFGENNDDWEAAFKYLMKSNISKHYEDQQQEEWLRLQELRKHSFSGSSGLNQFNMFGNDNSSDNNILFQQNNEISRMMYNQQYSQQQQQQRINHGTDMNHVHPSMSKFFDFHKNQQQQQQNQFMMNSTPLSDQLNMANLLEGHHRMNPNFVDQSNSLSHLQKQRLLNKYDGSNIGYNSNHPQNRMHSSSAQYSNQSVEDDLGFDPFKETQKALAELINDEASQQQQQQQVNGNNSQRSRMAPPPGFNHLQTNNYNNFGMTSPRGAQSGSKFPFVNSQMPQQPNNNWSMHMGFPQNTPDVGGFPQQQPSQHPNNQHKTGFGSNFSSDWSSLSIDPAIVSFRQFPQFNPQQQQPQTQNNDLFMTQMNQQGSFGMNMPSQASPAQVFSHSMNNYHMNNLSNGFSNSSFDKFSMPMSCPPGFQNSNGKQKTECIN